jgi:hypothetical protein
MPPDKHFDDRREQQGAGVDAVRVVAGGVARPDPPPHRGADRGSVPAAFDDRHFGPVVLADGVGDGEDVVDHFEGGEKKLRSTPPEEGTRSSVVTG